ncbi:hypothetical protein KAH81_01885, partial [bacterium]|nr:hypothetical protein [bacterium]
RGARLAPWPEHFRIDKKRARRPRPYGLTMRNRAKAGAHTGAPLRDGRRILESLRPAMPTDVCVQRASHDSLRVI